LRVQLSGLVERLLARHGLAPLCSLEPLPGGQLNTTLRVNGEYVLRFREPTRATGSLAREAAVLARIRGRVPSAEVVVSGVDEVLGEYLLQKWVPGRTLLEAWLESPDLATREWWLTQWIEAVRSLHEERFPRPGSVTGSSPEGAVHWRGYIESRIRKRLDWLIRIPGLPRDLLLAVERFLRQRAGALEDGPFCLIHRDLHFGNVLVDGPQLTAILDFELAEAGPPDYELDTIYRFLSAPRLFAVSRSGSETGPAAADRITPARFASVWIRLKRGYPQLFAVPHLRERLSLYALDYELSCLAQACAGLWRGDPAVEPILRRIGIILDGRYGPE
jgi:aminoglycoside phosphotransferase (APT) family kinase protein